MDIEFLLWLQSVRESSSPLVQAFFAFMGSEAAIAVVMVVPCLAYWCLDKRRGMLAMMAYGLSTVFNQLIKNTVCCYRPWIRDARVHPVPSALKAASGYSFPSGHTQSSASMLGGLGWAWRDRRWPLVASLAFTALVGFSRNFLGVHTPQDVVVGFFLGLLFVLVADILLAWVDEDATRDVRVVLVGLALTVVFLVYATLKPYPHDYVDGVLAVDPAEMLVDCYKSSGVLIGTLLGWLFERRCVNFATGGLALPEIVARVVVGAVLIAVVHVPIGHLLVALLGEYAGQLLRHILTFILIIGVAPLAFAPLSRFMNARKAA